jgi:hypothetical protein
MKSWISGTSLPRGRRRCCRSGIRPRSGATMPKPWRPRASSTACRTFRNAHCKAGPRRERARRTETPCRWSVPAARARDCDARSRPHRACHRRAIRPPTPTANSRDRHTATSARRCGALSASRSASRLPSPPRDPRPCDGPRHSRNPRSGACHGRVAAGRRYRCKATCRGGPPQAPAGRNRARGARRRTAHRRGSPRRLPSCTPR